MTANPGIRIGSAEFLLFNSAMTEEPLSGQN